LRGQKRVRLTSFFSFIIVTSKHAASIPHPELLAYAQSLSAFTSAPPNMPDMSLPGQPPPPLFFPPFPNEEKMRKGRLNAEAPLGLLGETHSVGRRELCTRPSSLSEVHFLIAPTISPKSVGPTRMGPSANPYRQDHRPQQQFFDLDLDLNPDL
jgi:mediator of RNA polymerase II transcription subunit 4